MLRVGSLPAEPPGSPIITEGDGKFCVKLAGSQDAQISG